jgi:hypothetical protein
VIDEPRMSRHDVADVVGDVPHVDRKYYDWFRANGSRVA